MGEDGVGEAEFALEVDVGLDGGRGRREVAVWGVGESSGWQVLV